MKKLTVLILSVVLVFTVLLSGCGSGIYGYYEFQMGKSDEMHVGMYMNLSKDDYVNKEGTALGKKYEMKMSIPEKNKTTGAMEMQDIELSGYFSTEKGIEGERLKLYIVFYEGVEIGPEFLDLFLYAEIIKDEVIFASSVGTEDMQFQLYWYGIDIDLVNMEKPLSIVDKHPVGTHPTKDDIKKINEEKKYSENHNDKHGEPMLYRDFYTLTVNLKKVG